MRLIKARLREFRSIIDSGDVEFGDVTCLVGKNEAGKTAVLHALYKLNPYIEQDEGFDVTDDYPRAVVEDYKYEVEEGAREPAVVVEAEYQLDAEDLLAVSEAVCEGALAAPRLVMSRGYDDGVQFSLEIDEPKVIGALTHGTELVPELDTKLKHARTLAEARAALDQVEATAAVQKLRRDLDALGASGDGLDAYIFNEVLFERVPKFLYFSEYSQMRGCENIQALQSRLNRGALQPSDYPLLGLIRRARLELTDLISVQRTRELKNRLEGAGNHLTRQIVKYWSQNKYLQLRFDVRPAVSGDPPGMQTGTNIWGDVYDSRHQVTTEFGSRSRGFVWFFSFLAWYGDVVRQKQNVVLLLDEPGMSLHGRAQEDLLRYFEAEVVGNHQLVYTTHSPFMVDPCRFDRVRIVQDMAIEEAVDPDGSASEEGTKITTDVLRATHDSLFPLQGALGYEIQQSLFVGPNSLVVEGVSDLLYLQAMSEMLEARNRSGLDPRWVVTPVGSAAKVSTFVALLSSQKGLNVAVLVDYQKADHQMIENLYRSRLLSKSKVLTFADFVDAAEADVEDLVGDALFATLVNGAYGEELSKKLELGDLVSRRPRILARVETWLEQHPLRNGGGLNHYRPARYLLDARDSLDEAQLGPALDRFEAVFARVNALL